MNKTLIACFSATNTTFGVAKTIAAKVSGDLFRIVPETPYTPADLNWNNSKSRSSVEMKDPASRPKIADKVPDMGAYQTIFLGFPIWWYVAPHIILTFLGEYDFTGKTIIPFATSGGSGLGETENILKSACPRAIWKSGICFAGHVNNTALETWLKDLAM